MHLRLRYTRAGGHVHVRVFMGPDRDHLANCGALAFRAEEWETLATCGLLVNAAAFAVGLTLDAVEES